MAGTKRTVLLVALAALALAAGLAHRRGREPAPAAVAALPTTPGVVAADAFALLAIKRDGRIWRLGRPHGADDLGPATVPVPASATADWRFLSIGQPAAYAISADRRLWRWGFRDPDGFQPLFAGWRWRQVRQAGGHAIGLTDTGALFVWAERGPDAPDPGALAELGPGPWQDACTTRSAVYAVDAAGGLWSAALAEAGAGPATPERIAAPAVLAHVFCSGLGNQVFVTDPAGRLWGRGGNHYGELGSTGRVREDSFVAVGDAAWSDVAVGGGYVLGLRRDGSLWAWGLGTSGQLGLGDRRGDPAGPAPVAGGHTWLAVAAGHSTSAGITSTGALLTWGSGAIGDGGVARMRDEPGPVDGLGLWGSDSIGESL